MTEEEQYLFNQDLSGLKAGDKVKVLRAAIDFENGWQNSWPEEAMNKYIGKIYEISDDCGYAGFGLDTKDDHYFSFPYFVLEKVENFISQNSFCPRCGGELTEKTAGASLFSNEVTIIQKCKKCGWC